MTDDFALLVADVYELAGALRRVGEATAAQEGQTQARWQLLSVLSAQPESVPRAARRLGVTRQAVQRVANELVASGLAEFLDNPDHRTSPLLSLTPEGRGTLSAITRRAGFVHRRLGERVGTDTVTRTRQDIRTLLQALDAE